MKKYFALPNRGSIDHRGKKNKRKHSLFETVPNSYYKKDMAQHDSLESLTENIASSNFKPIDSNLKKSPTFQKDLSELDSLCKNFKHAKLEDPDGFYF
tara:strand:- start:161 stop:454 length:294 start_codon:yes stop_codon:yes gene_type:complete